MNKDDSKFLRSLMPAWVLSTPRGLCATMYGTGTYEGDKEISVRVNKILAVNKSEKEVENERN